MNNNNEVENRTREVERYLYRLGDYAERKNEEVMENFTCQLDISEVGSWVVKFRTPHRVIINNAEMILTDNIKIDAIIEFSSLGNFWATINGNLSVDAGASHMEGTEEALHFFKSKIFSSSVENTVESISTKTATRAYIRQSHAVEESITSQPVWSGWMLKKKEILHGWNSRYFKVYIGRFEYFMDPNDDSPRAVIPLLDAKVSLLQKEIRVKGYDMHYQLMVEPKYHEKSFRLASERGGSAGKKEIQNWQAAFDIGSKPANVATQMIAAAKAKNLLLAKEGEPSVGATGATGAAGAAGGGGGDIDMTTRGSIGTSSRPSLISAVRRSIAGRDSSGGLAIDPGLANDDSGGGDGSGGVVERTGNVPVYVYVLGTLGAILSVMASALYGKVHIGSSGLDVILGLLTIGGGVQGAKIIYASFISPSATPSSRTKRQRKQSRGLLSPGIVPPSPDPRGVLARGNENGNGNGNDTRRSAAQGLGSFATPQKAAGGFGSAGSSPIYSDSTPEGTWRDRQGTS